jgi:hypothetical protein
MVNHGKIGDDRRRGMMTIREAGVEGKKIQRRTALKGLLYAARFTLRPALLRRNSWNLSFKFEERKSSKPLAARNCTDVNLEPSCDKTKTYWQSFRSLEPLRASPLPNMASILGIIFASFQS